MPPIDNAERKLACLQRELKMRRKVYPRWVKDRKMAQAQADAEIAIMTAIVEDYRMIVDQLDLFAGGKA